MEPEVSRTSKVLALSLGKTLTTLASIVFGMIAARVLSKHDYATMRQTMLAYSFIAAVNLSCLMRSIIISRTQERKRGNY